MSSPEKKVWLVTGASSGLGRAVVEHLLKQGNPVVATLRKPDDISDLVRTHSADQLLVVKLDVVVPAEITTAFAQAISKFGRVDVVYNNAGLAGVGEIEGTPDEVARAMFEVNFWGLTNVSKEAVRVFRDVNKPCGGRLLQVSSRVGISAAGGMGFYSASKHAVEGISQALASEVHPSWNIKVTILEFGGIRTRAVQDSGMPIYPPHPAYTAEDSPSAIVRRRFTDGTARNVAADANKTAREVYKIAQDETVGLRAILGTGALAMVKGQLESVGRDAEASAQWNTDLAYDG